MSQRLPAGGLLVLAIALLIGWSQPERARSAGAATESATALLGATTRQGGVLRVVAARSTADSDLAQRDWGVHSTYLKDHLDSGRLFVVVANDGDGPLTIEGVRIGGQRLDELTDDMLFSERIESLNWWQAAPRTLEAGEHGTLRMRLLDRSDFGDPTDLTLITDSGDIDLEVTAQRSPLWLPFVGFTADGEGALSTAIVYVANRGGEAVTLPEDGGIRIDGQSVTGLPAQRTIPPGGLVPVAIGFDSPPGPGDWVVVEVVTEEGATTVGSLRAFAADFSIGFWQLGENPALDAPHLADYGIDLTTAGATVAVDEPFRIRMSPSEMAELLEERSAERGDAPTMVQLSGYEEVLLYSDLADITMTHHREVELDLSLALSWPKPIWYLPQDAWGRNSRPQADEKWYPLEELEQQALTGIGGGAKHLQWFTYFNLWQQGYGLGGALDANRSHLDLMLSGAVGNPALLDRVGRLSLNVRTVASYLALSAPAGRLTDPGGDIESSTLISGMDRAVVVLLDRSSPESLYERSEPGARPHTLVDRSVEALAPSFLVAERAWLIDPFEGVREVPFERIDDTRIRLDIDRFSSAAILLLGDDSDGEMLRERRNAIAFPDSRAPLDRMADWAERAAGGWRLPEARYRLPFEVSNDGDGIRRTFEVVLSDPPRELDRGGHFVLLEILPDGEGRETELYYRSDAHFFDPSAREGDTLDPGGRDEFAHLYTVEHSSAGRVNRYRSHPDERYAFTLTPEFGDGWISADFRRLDIEAQGVEAGHAAKQHRVFIDFDLDGDGRPDGGANPLLIDLPSRDLGDGWRRYQIDLAAAFAAGFPDEEIGGRWRPRFQIEMAGDETQPESLWTLGSMRAYSNARLLLQTEGIPAGESRSFELYIATAETTGTGAVPPLPEARLPVRTGPLEIAGAELDFDDSGRLQLTPQARGDGLLVLRWSADGTVLARTRLNGESSLLPGELQPGAGEFLDITTLTAEGVGHRFAFAAGVDGALYDASGDDLPAIAAVESTWSDRGGGWESVDGDISPDGSLAIVAERQFREDEDLDDELWFGRIRLLNSDGSPLWSWPPDGERSGTIFAARFGADGKRLYLAAQRTPIDDQDYHETELLAFDTTRDPPAALWRRTVGEGFDEPGRAVHRMVATPDGGLLYADWHGRIFRLDPDGAVRWTGRVGGYALALADDGAGGAYALNFAGAHHFGPDGDDERVAQRSDGSEGRALGVSVGGDLVAFADTRLTLIGAQSTMPDSVSGDSRPLLGRHPRVIAVANPAAGEPLVAVGASDGTVQLFGPDGSERWIRQGRGSMVADLHFVADGTLLVAREVFDYDPDTLWRFRTVVEAYDTGGTALWRSPGLWRDQPTMARLAVAADESVALVIGGEMRRIDLP